MGLQKLVYWERCTAHQSAQPWKSFYLKKIKITYDESNNADENRVGAFKDGANRNEEEAVLQWINQCWSRVLSAECWAASGRPGLCAVTYAAACGSTINTGTKTPLAPRRRGRAHRSNMAAGDAAQTLFFFFTMFCFRWFNFLLSLRRNAFCLINSRIVSDLCLVSKRELESLNSMILLR